VARLGIPYRFQHPIPGTPWFADYAFPTLRILLEVDGPSHHGAVAQAKDAVRDSRTAALGWRTVRVTNAQALSATEDEVREWLSGPTA